jgi:hypothetical protein
VVVLEEGDVLGLIEGLQRTFNWEDRPDQLVAGESWRSKTSSFFPARPAEAGRGVVLKVGHDWSPEDARTVYDQLVSLQNLIAGSGVDIEAPAVLGWLPEPPSICMELIEGEDLDEILDRRDGFASPEPVKAVEESGALLGLFHESETMGEAERREHAGEARRRVDSMLGQLRIRQSPIQGIDLAGFIAPRYGDYAPYNMRLDTEGQTWLLDQPAPRSYDIVHRDVAWYAFALIRNVGRDADPGSDEVRAARERLVSAFLAGYARTGARSMTAPEDQLLLSVHYAHFFLWAAKRRWRQRRYREVVTHLRLAGRWRSVVLRANTD